MSREADAVVVQRSFARMVRALGLARPDTTPCGMPMSVTEAHALAELHDDGPVSQQVLADRLRLQKSTVSRLVDQLQADGLVRRTANPDDRRSVLLALTASGRRRAARLDDARRQMFESLVGRLSAAERRRVIDALCLLEEAAHALD